MSTGRTFPTGVGAPILLEHTKITRRVRPLRRHPHVPSIAQQGKLWANVMTMGGVPVVQAFTADCRACGHKVSLHDRGGDPKGNAYAAPVAVQHPAPVPPRPVVPPPPPQVPAGWYRDPNGQPCNRWWDGHQWTNNTAPLA